MSSSEVVCPICGLSVNSKSINDHVDTCLDFKKTGETSATKHSGEHTRRSHRVDSGCEMVPPAKKPRFEVKSTNMTNKWQSIFQQPQKKQEIVSPNRSLKSTESKRPEQKTHHDEEKTSNEEKSASGAAKLREGSIPNQSTYTKSSQFKPLAEIMRPMDLDDYIGQSKAIGQNSVLRTLLESDHVPSCILWGPPGCGKTSLANVIANRAKKNGNLRFVKLSATSSNLSEVKTTITAAKNEQKMFKRKTILFIDEIHRFNKLQQDAFLPHVENGTITLIGATTENPSFRVNSALLSRCRVVVLEKLCQDELEMILKKGAAELELTIVKDDDVKSMDTSSNKSNQRFITQPALTGIGLYCDGDARTALNTLQLIAQANESTDQSESNTDGISVIDMAKVRDVLQRSHVVYDRTGEEHYNCISALIKSMRGSDANAALYWLGRMILGGEDPLFVARRLIVFASEDVGLADAQALPLAVATYSACHYNGMPECQINLSHCVVYLARAPKSTESYMAYNRVKDHIENHEGAMPGVPLHLRNAPTKLMKDMGYAKGYKRTAGPGQQSYLPEQIAKIDFFKDKKRF
ncbi:ATPase WRNIP1-like [Antedon mediterranea]|uniref:ATPase WRNIP1-like n=1 Tax=Antedon mediterranea TaxID=105859 RepID=UPI003AF6BE3E